MNIREELFKILPSLLPQNPREALKGTELIQALRNRINLTCSDASLRYHFSIMSCDPSSPIARKESGQGYYLRSSGMPILSTHPPHPSYQSNLGIYENPNPFPEISRNRIEKIYAILVSFYRSQGAVFFPLRESLSEKSPASNLWEIPPLVLIDWELAGQFDEQNNKLNPDEIELKALLGLPPCQIRAIQIREKANPESIRQDFFQALSVSSWAQSGELIYSSPIEDKALIESLHSLSTTYGIGVSHLGMSTKTLDLLPSHGEIPRLNHRENEALLEYLDYQRVTNPKIKSRLSWENLRFLYAKNPEIRQLFSWIQKCAKERKILSQEKR